MRLPESIRIKRWCLLIVLVLPLAPAIANESGSETVWVLTREMCGDLFLIPLTWTGENGSHHELVAVFDTGGSNFFIDPDCLIRISGTRVKPGKRVSQAGVSAVGLSFETFRPRVKDLDHISRPLGRQLDVFLPFHAFDELLLTLDYGRGELRLSRGELPDIDGLEVFSTDGPDRRPWLEVRVDS